MNLSNRLLACCDFVNPGDRVADIGCDHGYVGIHLLLTGKASSVIASDIHSDPLNCARRNAEKYGVRSKMSFYLSDGLLSLPRDFDCVICAGMGADTIISILERAPWLKRGSYRLILQCQSKRPLLRSYLSHNGFTISRETLAKDGRFVYPVMEVLCVPSQPLTPEECFLSPALRNSGSPLLPEFRDRVLSGLDKTVAGLSAAGGEKYETYLDLRNRVADLPIPEKEGNP